MGIRDDFERRIARKEQEITELELKLRDARSYLQALEDALKMIPHELLEHGAAEGTLRTGSSLSQARDAIRKAGRPMHITDILRAIGKPVDKKNRVSLASGLAAYVRKGEVFTRHAPNTYGLVEFGVGDAPGRDEGDDLPDTFGKQ